MRALAHPLRLDILDHLRTEGPATATALAKALRVSTASTSYHLSQLAKHGFIEEAPTAGQGRERPWRARALGEHWAAGAGRTRSYTEAARLLRDTWLARRLDELDAYLEGEGDLEPDWREAAFLIADVGHVTIAELQEISERIGLVLSEYRRHSEATRPEGLRRVRFFAYGVPDLQEQSQHDPEDAPRR